MSVFVPGNIPKLLITQKKKPKQLPAASWLLSITTVCTSAGGRPQQLAGRSRTGSACRRPSRLLKTERRIKSQRRVPVLWEGSLINWTLMHRSFCRGLTLPARPPRGVWERSSSSWAPWCCSTAKPREGSSTLGRSSTETLQWFSPPETHQTIRILLMLSNGESFVPAS